jgi:hypothetical protein
MTGMCVMTSACGRPRGEIRPSGGGPRIVFYVPDLLGVRLADALGQVFDYEVIAPHGEPRAICVRLHQESAGAA